MTRTVIKIGVVALAAALCLLAIVKSNVREENSNFAYLSRAAAGAIFAQQGGKGDYRFICSGTTIKFDASQWDEENRWVTLKDVVPIPSTDGYFATASHCVVDENGNAYGPEQVSFSANEAGPFYTAVPWKVSVTDDVAILRIINGGNLPGVRLGTEYELQPNEALTNYTFALSFGMQPVVIHAEGPGYTHMPSGMWAKWAHTMGIVGPVAPGSSGSGLFSPRQHALVGVAVGLVTGTGFAIAEPVSTLWRLIVDPTAVAPVWNAPVVIPDGDMQSKFGKDHAFTLTAHGVNPSFTQGGYKFQLDTFGFELSDKYYYDVPVYIIKSGDTYRLVSSIDESASLEVKVTGKA